MKMDKCINCGDDTEVIPDYPVVCEPCQAGARARRHAQIRAACIRKGVAIPVWCDTARPCPNCGHEVLVN